MSIGDLVNEEEKESMKFMVEMMKKKELPSNEFKKVLEQSKILLGGFNKLFEDHMRKGRKNE